MFFKKYIERIVKDRIDIELAYVRSRLATIIDLINVEQHDECMKCKMYKCGRCNYESNCNNHNTLNTVYGRPFRDNCLICRAKDQSFVDALIAKEKKEVEDRYSEPSQPTVRVYSKNKLDELISLSSRTMIDPTVSVISKKQSKKKEKKKNVLSRKNRTTKKRR